MLNHNVKEVADKIEQLGTEYLWANTKENTDLNSLHRELGDDLLAMWKGLYFAETGDPKRNQESKKQGSTRVCGPFGMKIWDDDGIVYVVKADFVKGLSEFPAESVEVMGAICSAEGQKLLTVLKPEAPMRKEEIIAKTEIALTRLNELLTLLEENKVVEHCPEHSREGDGYKISGHCGIAAYMALAAMYVLNKKDYTASQYLINSRD